MNEKHNSFPGSGRDSFAQGRERAEQGARSGEIISVGAVAARGGKATGRQIPANRDRYYAEHLVVDIKPRSEYIEIAVTDQDPNTAQAAVAAITNAYYDFFINLDRQQERQRTGVLDDTQANLQLKIDGLTKEIDELAEEYGTTHLGQLFEAATQRVLKLDAALA